MSTTPGLMFATSRPIPPTTEAQLNDFYRNEHLPDVLSYGAVKMTKRYKNVNPDSAFPYLALYPVDEVNYFKSKNFEKVVEETKLSRTFGNKSFYDFLEFEIGSWSKIQSYEGSHSDPSTKPAPTSHAKTLIAVTMQPAPDPDTDPNSWYKKQYLDTMATLPTYRRTTRYKRVAGDGDDDGEGKPSFSLVLHEYDCKADELPEPREEYVRRCEVWGREVWELVEVQGDGERQL
ncbi:hypothetical protein LTR56_017822 [Elasticomyces elasticus]|nr:hypothetical protein LTR22_022025 [Elasticomyces elasticus]KAK3629809.1 hypothetical protein LTR56_017822 [Elasticomyces elasticus]KAK4917503.1 hypothetical protein LTR49_014589 [Elasticomyces elasticus]KAK5756373.1 hypothetical protein LTS12_013562 [Elasticomyces elasticus]